MKTKEKIEKRRFEKFWDTRGRKDMFTWAHRYFRLHNELLVDSVYQQVYDFIRNTLIEYLRKDIKGAKIDDINLGRLIDELADTFNIDNAVYVNKCEPVVAELYKFYKENPEITKDIKV